MEAPGVRLVASTGDDYNYKDKSRSPSPASSTSTSSEWSDRTHDTYSTLSTSSNSSISDKIEQAIPRLADQSEGNFRSLLWSSDGTSLVTTSADNVARTFILPPNLLESSSPEAPATVQPSPHHLSPYSSHVHPNHVQVSALSPFYTLGFPETTLVLTSPESLPIRLLSPFAPGSLATFPLVNPQTEQWIAPHSLLFSGLSSNFAADSGNSLRFLAGSRSQISLFDASRDGCGPIATLATAPGNRKARRGGSHVMTGIVSSMAISSEGILAAGTFSRGVGLYDAYGMGDSLGAWSLKDSEDGDGVTGVQWSKCGRYLLVAERGSDGLSVWDVRGAGSRLAWLSGRKADTMQRLDFALGNEWRDNEGSENVYAGGMDGCVRVWNNVGKKEGHLDSDWLWKAHDDVVSGIKVHTCGSVLATSSGSRRPETSYDEASDAESASDVPKKTMYGINGGKYDNSVRVWSLEMSTITFDEAGTSSFAAATTT